MSRSVVCFAVSDHKFSQGEMEWHVFGYYGYPEDSVNGRVAVRLSELARHFKEFGATGDRLRDDRQPLV